MASKGGTKSVTYTGAPNRGKGGSANLVPKFRNPSKGGSLKTGPKRSPNVDGKRGL